MLRHLPLLLLSCVAATTLQAQTNSQWVTIPPGSPTPSARINHAMASDGSLCWMFGGQDASGLRNDLWAFDGTNWIDFTPTSGTAPLPRQGHGMVWDTLRSRLVIQGGETVIGGTPVGETWTIDLTTSPATWVQLGAGLQRSFHGMSYDSARDQVVAFGGALSFITLGQTSEFDGMNWAIRQVAEPPARFGTSMAFDSDRNVTVLFGGQDPAQFFADTWEWNGTSWSQQTPAAGPVMRANHAMTFDSFRGVTVMSGGQTVLPVVGPFVTTDTWEWDGTNWIQFVAGGPLPNTNHVMGSTNTRTFAFGGSSTPAATPTLQQSLTQYHTVQFSDQDQNGNTFPSCPSSTGPITLTPSGLPRVGTTMTVNVSGMPASSPVTMHLDISTWSTGLSGIDLTSIGAPGCMLFTVNPIAVPLTNTGGTAPFVLTLPASSPWIFGVECVMQAIAGDSINALGVVTSPAFLAIIG